MTLIDKHIKDLHRLCSQCDVRNLYAFGSVITDDFSKDSDLDFIVEFQTLDSQTYAENYFALKFSLEQMFERKIDLLEEKAIRNPYFRQSIENHRQIIYAA